MWIRIFSESKGNFTSKLCKRIEAGLGPFGVNWWSFNLQFLVMNWYFRTATNVLRQCLLIYYFLSNWSLCKISGVMKVFLNVYSTLLTNSKKNKKNKERKMNMIQSNKKKTNTQISAAMLINNWYFYGNFSLTVPLIKSISLAVWYLMFDSFILL